MTIRTNIVYNVHVSLLDVFYADTTRARERYGDLTRVIYEFIPPISLRR